MRILFVTPRFPFPPRRGDQVRAYHQLRLLARRHEVRLCALVRRRPRPAEMAHLEAFGVKVVAIPLRPVATAASLARVFGGDRRPLQTLLYWSGGALRRVRREIQEHRPHVVHLQLVRTAPYLGACTGRPVVVDLIDALSVSLGRRAARERGVRAAVLGWEARRLARAETELVAAGLRCVVVSEAERSALGNAGVSTTRVSVNPNGVDLDVFNPARRAPVAGRVVFAGNLGYFPNVEAAMWLVEEILPRLQALVPGVTLRLVGARPSWRLRRAAARNPAVCLAGPVEAMDGELAAAAVVAVPVRSGGGIQNKLLEAWAAGAPVVATRHALCGTRAQPGVHLLVADDAQEFARALAAVLAEPRSAAARARAARELVEAEHSWERAVAGLEAVHAEACAEAPLSLERTGAFR